MSKRFVIVGGGQAGFAFADELRRKDKESAITLLCEEAELPYQRPPLSKQYVKDDASRDRLFFRDTDWFDRKDIEVRTSAGVAGIDRQSKQVALAGGESCAYDMLMLATGSTPRQLPVKIGGGLSGVLTVRNISDADQLRDTLAPGKRILVVGGGYIGLEAAAVARSFDCEVRVVEMAERILRRVACTETSNYFRTLHQSNGVVVNESLGLDHLEGDAGNVAKAFFTNGESMHVDAVVVGIGIEPNVQLAVDAGLVIDNGIAVNQFAQTSDELIYSAGDCASFDWRGSRIRLESVQNAVDQAKAAAQHACGVGKPYDPTPWFWSDQYDVKLQIAGLNTGFDKIVRRTGSRKEGESFWYFKGDQLLALDAMNDAKTYVMGRKVLELGKPISPKQVADASVDLKLIATS
ncbi:MAG: FAD-dependent oxidoreductase [Granulosicoccaceae bacterium]